MAKKKAGKKKKTAKKPNKKSVRKKAVKKKAAKKRPAKKAAAKKKKTASNKKTAKKGVVAHIGVVTHYFPHVKAAVVKCKQTIAVGDWLQFKGHTTDFKQEIKSLEIDRKPIQKAGKGKEIGLKVKNRVRAGDLVYQAKGGIVSSLLSKLPF